MLFLREFCSGRNRNFFEIRPDRNSGTSLVTKRILQNFMVSNWTIWPGEQNEKKFPFFRVTYNTGRD